jgi:hypothetical protein
MTAFVRSGRPGWRLRTANPLIAGGPDPSAVIQIRDRLAAHAEVRRPRPVGAFVSICTIRSGHHAAGRQGPDSSSRSIGVCGYSEERREAALPFAIRSNADSCAGLRLDDRRGLRHAPRPRTTIRSCISKSLLGKYTIEFSSRRDRVSFELHDRRPIVAAIQRGVLDPSPET